jgi:CsbD-like.
VKEVTEDRTRGEWDQTKGVIKEKVGKITGDRSTEVSGKLDQVKGKLEKKIGEAKDTIRHEDVRNR